MTALRELFATFSVNFDSSALTKGAAAVDGVAGKLRSLGAALAGSAILGGIIALTHHTIEVGDELNTAAERIGLGTQALQQWRYVADLADVSNEELSSGFKILQKNVEGAAAGAGDSAADFKKLGVSVADLKSGNLDQILTKTADGFAALTNPIEKSALAQKLFGRGGLALVPLLSKGSAGVAELKEEFVALGGGLSDETIAAANDADDAFKRLRFGVTSLLYNAMRPFIRVAIDVATALKEGVVWFNRMARGSEVITAALVALGAVAVVLAGQVLIAFAPLILTTLAWGAAIAAAILIVDDLITLFQGGKSVIGKWIDATWGVGTASKVVETVKGYWEGLTVAVGEAWETLKLAAPVVDLLGTGLHDLGQDLAFVIDQWKSFADLLKGKGELAQGLAMMLGFEKKPGQEFAGAADGLGSVVSHTDKQGNVVSDTGRGFFGDLTKFAGERRGTQIAAPVSGGAITLPEVSIAGGSAAGAIDNSVHITVAANAKPDPQLLDAMKKVATDVQSSQNRKVAAAFGGT